MHGAHLQKMGHTQTLPLGQSKQVKSGGVILKCNTE